MGEYKHEAFLAGSDGSWLLMPRCKGMCKLGGWLKESFPMHNSRKTQDASSRATRLIFMEVSWVIFTAVHTVVRSGVIAWTLPGLAGSTWWLHGWELWLHITAAPWETGEECRRWHMSRPLQKLGRSYSWSRFRMQSSLWVSFAKTLYLWYSSFILLICPFSFSFFFGGKCMIFQSFSAYETCFQSIIHYQADT